METDLKADDAAGQAFWNAAWAGFRPEVYPGPILEFHELYSKYLPCDASMSCVEIGAMPGNNLVYFHREFGYRVTAIDYCADLTPIMETMRLNGIEDYRLINADVFKLAERGKYDAVFSSGFVEHFEDYRGVFALHAGMVKDGGYLLITIPNTKNLHKWLMRMFCPEIYAVHRDFLMDRGVLRGIAENLGFEVLYCDYLRTFRVFYPLPYFAELWARALNKLLRLVRLDRVPNAYASPYLYLVARRARGSRELDKCTAG